MFQKYTKNQQYGLILSFVLLIVCGTVHAQKQPNLQLLSLSANWPLHQNQTGSFTATLKNNGNAAYNSRLWVYMEKPVTYSPNQTIGGDVFSIAVGETKTIAISGNITLLPAIYNCNMVYDANNNPSDMNTYQFDGTILGLQVEIQTPPSVSTNTAQSTNNIGFIKSEITPQSRMTNTCDDIESETSLFTTLNFKVIDSRINNYNYVRIHVHYKNYYTISIPWDGKDGIYNIVNGTERVEKSFLVAEAERKNPTLKFNDVPDEYLTLILTKTDSYYSLHSLFRNNSYSESSIKISNENAKVALGSVSVGGIFSIGTPDGVFNTRFVPMEINVKIGEIAQGYGTLVYCNADCDITGRTGYNGIIDIRLKKGWNMIFEGGCSSYIHDMKTITIKINDVELYMPAG